MSPYGCKKKGKLYTLCTLILSSPFHLTIGSRLILTQNAFEFQIVVVQF
jgi:hypothetical protein